MWLTVMMIMAPLLFLHAQSVRITATLDSTNYRVGDWIRIQLSAEHASQATMLWDQPVKLAVPGFEKLAESAIDSIQQNDFLTERKTITITTFDTGVWQIPPITCYFLHDGRTDSASTNPLSVYVSYVAVDTAAAARPMKGIFPVATDHFSVWWLLLSVISLILLLLTAWYFLLVKNRNKPSHILQNDDRRLPHEKAFDHLVLLEQQKPWEQKLVKEYYVQVTQILREYIESGLGMPALENTAHELIAALRKKPLDETLIRQLNADLQLADLVKFAKAQPATASHLQILHTAKVFIQQTAPVTPSPEQEGGAT